MQYISRPVEFWGFHGENGGGDNYRPPGSQEAVRSQWQVHHVGHLLSRSRLLVTLWTAAPQASLSLAVSQSVLTFMPTEAVTRVVRSHLVAEPVGWRLAGPEFQSQLLLFPAV